MSGVNGHVNIDHTHTTLGEGKRGWRGQLTIGFAPDESIETIYLAATSTSAPIATIWSDDVFILG